jgi:HPt (histidine-containing phosphotransfer) domain-containing protein
MRVCVGINSAAVCPERNDLRSTPIDRGHLARFTRGDLTLEREVLELVRVQLPLSLDRLGAAASGTEWKNAAHTIKGSAAAIGAWRLVRAAEWAEAVDFAGGGRRQRALGRVRAAAGDVLRHIKRLATP